jgi:copper chaperone CopZ
MPVQTANPVVSVRLPATRYDGSVMLLRQRAASLYALPLTFLIAFAAPLVPLGCSSKGTEPAPTQVVVYDVQGMHCDGCVAAITKKVLAVKGVTACDVSLDEHKATVTLASPATTTEVEDAVKRLGYTIAVK